MSRQAIVETAEVTEFDVRSGYLNRANMAQMRGFLGVLLDNERYGLWKAG
jgi:hypothetical protein